MRPVRVVAGMTILLFAVAACGQAANQTASSAGQPASSSADSASATPTSPPAPSVSDEPGRSLPQLPVPIPKGNLPPPGATPLPKEQVDTSGLPSYYTDRDVWSVNNGRTIAISAMSRDACGGVQARVVEQNADVVRIELGPTDVPQGDSPDGPGMCAQVLVPRVVTVDLKVPLGSRKVVVTGS